MYDFYDSIPLKEKNIISTLSKYSDEVYVVGGAVRDYILGVSPNDYDIVTNLTPNRIIDILSSECTNYKINEVGKSFGVISCDGVEIATFRKDMYFGDSDKNCLIECANTIEEDLSRRDLTIGSLAINVSKLTGKIIDPFDGMVDIKNKLVRFVGDPYARIKEDPNRMIRAARFAARIDGSIHPDTLDAIKNSHDLFNFISKERIALEITKAMKIKKASKFFIALHDMDLLKFIFPLMEDSFNHDGGNHHSETIFEHLMLVGDFISTKCHVLKLTGYLHDVGKVLAYNPETKQFLTHEFLGEKVVRKYLKDLRFSNQEVHLISSYIKFHMRSAGEKEKSVRKLVKELTELGMNYRSHTRLRCADRAGNLKKDNFKFSEIKEMLRRFEDLFSGSKNSVFSIKDLAVNGKDFMDHFNLKAGREIGELLMFTLEAIYDGKLNNTKEEALEFASKNYQMVGV